jgi:sphingolipid 4-desaturase/C4-monooxygenase
MFALAWAMSRYDAPWWAVFATAWLVGALLDHALWVLIHDATHDNVFPWTWLNNVTMIICNLPIVFPAAISFKFFHRKHHAQMGEVYADPDLASPWENRLFGHSVIGKMTWLLFFAVFQSLRTIRFAGIDFGGLRPWLALNWAAQLSFDVAVLYFFGWKSLVFMTASSLFAVGLHPVGARWIAEHFAVVPTQETYSYYGRGNAVILNVGYHNEHHDFPSIPWQRLPQLRAAAPEFYESLWYHMSYSRLIWDFIWNPAFTLETRMARLPKGGHVPSYLRSPELESRFVALAKEHGRAEATGPGYFDTFDADTATIARESKEADPTPTPVAAKDAAPASDSKGSRSAAGATRRRNVA